MRQALALKTLVLVGALALLAPIAPVPADAAQSRAAATAGTRAYLLTSDALVPVDLRTRTVGRSLALPAAPAQLVVSADGGTGWVLLRRADDAAVLQRVDLRSWTLGPAVDVGGDPRGLALTPDGTTLFVSTRQGGVRPVDAVTSAVGAPVALGEGFQPEGLAVTPDGRSVLVTTGCDPPLVLLVDITTRTVRRSFDLSAGGYVCPNDVAVAPDGRTAYSSGRYLFNGLVPIDLVTERAQPEIPMEVSASYDPQVSPDSRTAYVAADGTAIVDLRKRTVVLRYRLDGAFAVAPSGTHLLYALRGGGLALLSTRHRTLGPVFAPGVQARGVVFAPGQAPVAALRVSQRAGHAVSFDGAASVGVTSPVARYAWDFGDGTTAVTPGPTVRHVYSGAGTRGVRLTVTDEVGTSDTPLWGSTLMLRNGGPRATTTRTVTVR